MNLVGGGRPDKELILAETASPLSPLRYGKYRDIWLANLTSSFGALIQAVAAAWLMTSISNSVDMVALVQASTALPIMLFSLVGGAIADSFDRRKVMLVAQCFMLVVSALLTVSTYLGVISPWLLLAFTFLIGCGTALNNPSWQASVGDLVPRSDIPAAVALNSIALNLSRSAGPAVGGLILAAAGAAAAFAVNTVSYLAPLLALAGWKRPRTESALPREPLGTALFSGVRYVAMSPSIGKVLLRSFIFGFSAIVVLALLPVVTASMPEGGPLTYGLLLGSFGLGAIGGALLSGRMQNQLEPETLARYAFICFALCALIVGVSRSPWIIGLALFIGGASWVLALALFNVSVQLASPRWVVGRAVSFYQTAVFGGMALGSWTWGVAAEVWGLETALLSAAAVLLIGAATGLRYPLAPRVTLDLDPLDRWQVPQLVLELEPRSGPITVEITYNIAPVDIRAFMTVMAERERIRRRDGARRWRLLRDLGHPELWTESYSTPTWADYVRHNKRLTKADADISLRLQELHSGEGAPLVRRYIERPADWYETVARPGPPMESP